MTALPDAARPLDAAVARHAFAAILDGQHDDTVVSRFLIALAERGETAAELAGAALAMRERMIAVPSAPEALDVCGTGGDGHGTLNISTAVSLVVAACGVPVAKHGNRAASSLAGAADTLEALGLDLDGAERTAERTLAELGIAFLFAARHHPALARLHPVRRAIGRRTIFNLLGPLCNPAGVRRQLVGVARQDTVAVYAGALALLQTERASVVSGQHGVDELSLEGENLLAEVRGGEVVETRVTATDLGFEASPLSRLRGGDARHNAAALRALLAGQAGAYRDAVVLNAAAALGVADVGHSWPDRRALAEEAIDSGRAAALLTRWIEAAR